LSELPSDNELNGAFDGVLGNSTKGASAYLPDSPKGNSGGIPKKFQQERGQALCCFRLLPLSILLKILVDDWLTGVCTLSFYVTQY
jgi:hypothetical protein